MSEQPFGAHSADEPGPLGEQTARLMSSVQALTQDWLRDWNREPRSPDAAGHSARGGDCQWCPVCQFVAVLRGDRPELTQRVAEAGGAVVDAVRSFLDVALAAAAERHEGGAASGQHRQPSAAGPAGSPDSAGSPGSAGPAGAPGPRVQRIDLSDPS